MVLKGTTKDINLMILIWMVWVTKVDLMQLLNQRLQNVRKVVRVDKRITLVNLNKMCSSAAHYIDEEHYEKELSKKKNNFSLNE
jgi:hypothetical protein